MPRKLKTYLTSLGFFDLAVAAPSMKAALEAWGAESNMFHQGFAKESDDPAIVVATMAKPGVVLRRAVGSNGAFTEHAELPKALPIENTLRKPAKSGEAQEPRPRKDDSEAAEKAALAYEKEHKRRESERRKEEAAREARRKRRDQAIAQAEADLEKALARHAERTMQIERQREAFERKAQAEDARWEEERQKLEAALRRAKD